MKFGHTFETVAKSTWWEHERIDYKLLKKVLKAHDGAPHHEGNFMAAVLREIQKANDAFVVWERVQIERLATIAATVDDLHAAMAALVVRRGLRDDPSASRAAVRAAALSPAERLRGAADERLGALFALLDDVESLRQFARLNATAVGKIVKKHDKRSALGLRSALLHYVQSTPILTSPALGAVWAEGCALVSALLSAQLPRCAAEPPPAAFACWAPLTDDAAEAKAASAEAAEAVTDEADADDTESDTPVLDTASAVDADEGATAALQVKRRASSEPSVARAPSLGAAAAAAAAPPPGHADGQLAAATAAAAAAAAGGAAGLLSSLPTPGVGRTLKPGGLRKQACASCHASKVACEGYPCHRCDRLHVLCVYAEKRKRVAPAPHADDSADGAHARAPASKRPTAAHSARKRSSMAVSMAAAQPHALGAHWAAAVIGVPLALGGGGGAQPSGCAVGLPLGAPAALLSTVGASHPAAVRLLLPMSKPTLVTEVSAPELRAPDASLLRAADRCGGGPAQPQLAFKPTVVLASALQPRASSQALAPQLGRASGGGYELGLGVPPVPCGVQLQQQQHGAATHSRYQPPHQR